MQYFHYVFKEAVWTNKVEPGSSVPGSPALPLSPTWQVLQVTINIANLLVSN